MRRDLSFIFGYVVRFDMNFIYKKRLVLNFKESVLFSLQNEFWTIFELLIFTKKFHFEMIVLANAKILFPDSRGNGRLWSNWMDYIVINACCVTPCCRETIWKWFFSQNMRFGAHSSDSLVSQLQGSGMCHILNGSYLS